MRKNYKIIQGQINKKPIIHELNLKTQHQLINNCFLKNN